MTRSREAERVRGNNDREEETENTVDTKIGGTPSEENSVIKAVWKELKDNREIIVTIIMRYSRQAERET